MLYKYNRDLYYQNQQNNINLNNSKLSNNILNSSGTNDTIKILNLLKTDEGNDNKNKLESIREYNYEDILAICIKVFMYYAKPKKWFVWAADSWDKVPQNIKNVFQRLNIPEAEQQFLAWVWWQFDSSVVYHKLKEKWQKSWIIFDDISVAIREHSNLVEKYFRDFWPRLGLSREEFLNLGRKSDNSPEHNFNMGVFALKVSGKKNGVSKLHGAVSRELFGDIWPNIAVNEAPIEYITNGVHTCTWLAPNLKRLYNIVLTFHQIYPNHQFGHVLLGH